MFKSVGGLILSQQQVKYVESKNINIWERVIEMENRCKHCSGQIVVPNASYRMLGIV